MTFEDKYFKIFPNSTNNTLKKIGYILNFWVKWKIFTKREINFLRKTILFYKSNFKWYIEFRVQWKWYETYKYDKIASYHLFSYVNFNFKNNLEKAFFDWMTSWFPNLGFYKPHFSSNLGKSRNCNFVNFLTTEISFTKK